MLADRISFSSNANASLPRFDSEGHLIELRCGQIASLWQECVRALGVSLEVALGGARPIWRGPWGWQARER